MSRFLLLTFVSCGLLVSGNSGADAAQAGKNNKNNKQKNDERRENEAVQKAQKDVNEAEKSLREAEKSARQALEKLKGAERDQAKAASQLQKIRDDLEKKHADLTGVSEARRNLEDARRTYRTAGEPVLKRLAETSDYKKAVEAAKDADKRLSELRGDKDADADERRQQLAEASKVKLVPSQMERDALDAEQSLKSQRAKLKAAEEALAKSHDAMEKAIEKDPAIRSAKEAFEKSKREVAAARKVADQEGRQLTDARQKLAREQNDLQQKIAADRRDDNKPNNNRKNKN